ncbi:MAG: outer membrane protein assembly factor BamB family protein [Planctomycetota bacterium]|jgi:outer membrane protein assembly factor BamB
MIDVEEFIALLEEKDLVPPEVVAHLRRQIARPNARLSAALIAKWLVDRGHLSRLLAQRLLTQAEEAAKAADAGEEPFAWEKQAEAEEDEIGLAPLDDEIAEMPSAEKRKPAAPPRRAPKPPPAQPPQPPPAAAGSLLDDELTPLGAGSLGGAGPLDGLADDDSLTESEDGGGPLDQAGRRRRRKFKKRKKAGKRENVWDSPLMLIGGGTLAFLLILGGVLFWALRGRGADELLETADKSYRAGSYTQAIAQYDDYLERFSSRPEASHAVVFRGLAKLRQATDHGSDWSKSLVVAKEVLSEIAQEKAFNVEARPELVAILPKTAEGLANRARKELDRGLVAEAEEALALIDKYTARLSRPQTKLDEIVGILNITRRDISRGEELAKAIQGMGEAVESGDTAEAYQIRARLLRDYTHLIDNKELKEAVLKVSQAEESKVAWADQPRPAEAVRQPTPTVQATVVVARRSTGSVPPGTEGRVIYAVVDGAAYGLDAANGAILWRRPVGFATNGRSPAFPPTPISEAAQSDAIMVDADQNEVLRVEAASGNVGWRHGLGEPFDAHPVVADNRLLVATRSGRLVMIDLATGDSPGYVELPQELRVAPAVDSGRSLIYQVAEHSNLFVLSLSDGRAKQVVYLGHEPSSVTVAPVMVDPYLIVAENNGVDHSTLRVLSLEPKEAGAPPVEVVQSVWLKGHVDVIPQVHGSRVLVATDQGGLHVFDISGTDKENPLVARAETKTSTAQGPAGAAGLASLARFPLLRGGHVWVADSQLTQYNLNRATGQLQPKGIQNERSATLQPLVAIGQTVFHVRRRVGVPGVLVSAVAPDENEPLWEIHMAAPLATEPIVDAGSGQITAVTSIGAIYQVSAALADGDVVDQPIVALEPAEVRGPVADVLTLPEGLLAMTSADDLSQLLVFDPKEPTRFRRQYLDHPLAGRPAAFAGGLLAPSRVGQVFLLDPRTGEKLLLDPRSGQRIEPFQPELHGGVQVAWTEPAPISQTEFLLAESRTVLYRVGIKSTPAPHLAPLAQANLSEPITSSIGVLDQVAYVVDAGGSLLVFKLPDLEQLEPHSLGVRSAWGPRRVGDKVLLATDDDQLYCLGADGKIAWQIGLPYGPLAGAPLESNGSYLLASTSGVIWQIDAAKGSELAKVETGRPLGTGVVELGEGLVVGGHDGCLYKVQKP